MPNYSESSHKKLNGMATPLEQLLLLLLLLLPGAWLSWRNYEMRELLRGVN